MSETVNNTQGKALLASPYLDDPNFAKTVVFMVRHTQEDAFGLIVNRPTEHSIQNVVQAVIEQSSDRTGWLHFGGPVEGPLVALHDQPDLSDLTCSNGVYLTTERDRLLSLLERKHANVKLISGFSGWSGGQLESEMETGSWIVSDIQAAEVLGVLEGLWTTLIHRVGHEILAQSGFPLGDPAKAKWN
jgi:putative transcriptional regulator